MTRKSRSDAGFSLLEMLVAVAVMLVVAGIVTGALLQMTTQQQTIWNRTEMHGGVRGATELLQQATADLRNDLRLLTRTVAALAAARR